MANIAASVRQRLLNLSRARKRPFQEIMQHFVMERFLYRLSQSEYADCFVLKGALMLQVWDSPQTRPTMDIDMLGRISNQQEYLLASIRNLLTTPVEKDGLLFDIDSLQTETITQDADYQGVRVRGQVTLDTARARVQLDIGFGDIICPEPMRMSYPTLLDFPAPQLLCYSRESAIAEKLQAMVVLGTLNSRMKDFYDIWLLSQQFDFNLQELVGATTATFKQRQTALPDQPLFDDQFATEKQQQWRAFIRRMGENLPVETDFAFVLESIQVFVGEAINLHQKGSGEYVWPAGGVWQKLQPPTAG
ncbi:nucleotidyl transferase AbiEii/AbiGii toxin family protein [Marinospirillum sp.]|uniref:nucleotidyl transferase AbiEii/AbiGii toxin family protein n=1 Tax=Marinospirillum sp. TaxID=2183934 RepID=UPI0038511CD8